MTRLVRIFWKGSVLLSAAVCVTTCALWIMAPETVPPYTVARHSIEFWHDGQRWQLTLSKESGYIVNNGPQIDAEAKAYLDHFAAIRRNAYKLDRQARAASELLASLDPGTPEFAITAEMRGRLVDATMRALTLTRDKDPPALFTSPIAGFTISFAYVVAASATFPGLWLLSLAGPFLVRLRSRRRMLKGLCPECGYDLRASQARCPECGAAVVGLG